MNGVGKREKTRETSLDRDKSARGRERASERTSRLGVYSWQSLAMLYFLL